MLSAAIADSASNEPSAHPWAAPARVETPSSRTPDRQTPVAAAGAEVAVPPRCSGARRAARRQPIERWAILVSLALHIAAVGMLAVGSTPRPLRVVASSGPQPLNDHRVSVQLLERRARPLPAPVPAMPIAPKRQALPVVVAPTPVSQPVAVALAEPIAAAAVPVSIAAPPLTRPVEADATRQRLPAEPAQPADPAAARREQQEYVRALMAWLLRHRIYPDAAKKEKAQGIVQVRFTIDREGRVLSARVERGPGHASLERAALDVLARASPLPPIPPSMPMRRLTITLPIEYALRTE